MENAQHARRIREMLADLRAGRPLNTGGDFQAALEAGAAALDGNTASAYDAHTPRGPQPSAAAHQRENPGTGATLPDSTLPNPVATQPHATVSMASAPAVVSTDGPNPAAPAPVMTSEGETPLRSTKGTPSTAPSPRK